MRIGRVVVHGKARWGFVEGDFVRYANDDSGPGDIDTLEGDIPIAEADWLTPVKPGKVVAVGLNYRDHADELGMAIPDDPVLFMKPPSAVIGPGAPILLPPRSRQVDYEAELAVVMKSHCRRITADEAGSAILGYLCANDVTARDLQRIDGQWTRAKGYDTFCPLGPWIETSLDPSNLRVEALLNGRLVQRSSTAHMIFTVNELVAFISSVMTLEPGDVILTGTPPGVGPLTAGDTVTVRIEGLGELTNPAVAEGQESY